MSQFAFHLPLPTVFSEANFAVSESNFEAHALVTAWPNWQSHALYLQGPAGSGKSHLAHIWAERTNALVISAHNFTPENITNHCLLEDIEQCAKEDAMFHLYNISKQQNFSLLLTSACTPSELPFTLPDLTSRLRATPLAAIHAPNDTLLLAALRKQFSDKQLMVDDDVIHYIIPRIERSFLAVQNLVETLDSAALEQKKNITIPFVKNFLAS
jgi:chromosomal replication initiation ATPase DnaA